MPNRRIWFLLSLSAALVAAGFVYLGRPLPLGIPGEWEWQRLKVQSVAFDRAIAVLGIGLYIGFVILGLRWLRAAKSCMRETCWLLALFVAAAGVQILVQTGAPSGYGLTKWVTLGMPGSNGYFEVAKRQMADPWKFWAEYPQWIQRQDSLHVGTHPPGLFLWARGVEGYLDDHPDVARRIVATLPSGLEMGFRTILGPRTRSERAALVLTGFLTLLACAGTVVPIYLTVRADHTAAAAWATASLWSLVPSTILFQPTADTAFPLLATTALALAAWAVRGARSATGQERASVSRPRMSYSLVIAMFAGVTLGLGMQFSLVFLPVGLIVGIIILSAQGVSRPNRAGLFFATGAGFLALTFAIWGVSQANPFVIWWWNQRNHARFYAEYPRSYVSWVIVNLVELTVALGIPVAILAIDAFARRRASAVSWATLVVVLLLNLSGKNLSEVARLWLPFMPGLMIATAGTFAEETRGSALAGTLAILGVETVLLQAAVQVVYPI
jgi:hypothetical protein